MKWISSYRTKSRTFHLDDIATGNFKPTGKFREAFGSLYHGDDELFGVQKLGENKYKVYLFAWTNEVELKTLQKYLWPLDVHAHGHGFRFTKYGSNTCIFVNTPIHYRWR